MARKPSTPVKSIKKPSKVTKPVEMKRAKVDKVTDFKPSEQRRKAEEAKKKSETPPPHDH
jgi:hypothetical protein